MITYTEEKTFTVEQVQNLFRSVGWVSGEYPTRLHPQGADPLLYRHHRLGRGTAGGAGPGAG